MAGASYIQSSFAGGLVSQFAQGRYHDQHYRTWLDTCLNGFPIETEAWVRRPGFNLCGTTRGGVSGRLIKFDFQANVPYTMEFTDGHLRFWQSNVLVQTNDSTPVSSISTANPAVVVLASTPRFGQWNSGDQIYITGLVNNPLLENRVFGINRVDATHYQIVDAVTATNINGALLGALSGNEIAHRVYDFVTPYVSGNWQLLRSVQTDGAAFFLHPQFPPYELIINTQPGPNLSASFLLPQAIFQDGPYLDPIAGSTVTPGATSGNVTLTLGFQAYVATQAYTIGAFVSSGGIGYKSLIDANVGNTPASSPSDWQVVNFGAPINNGAGITAGDIGRLIRLFSEPALWATGTTYGSGTLVSYNPSNIPGNETFWSSAATGNLGNVPGTDASHWTLLAIGSTANPALWTWGKITGLSGTGVISGATGSNIGDLTQAGGLSAAFDGVTSKNHNNCATQFNSSAHYIGKNYGGGPTTISQAIVYPSNDQGWGNNPFGPIAISLYGGNSAPSGNFTNGTLLASTSVPENGALSPITLQSSNTSSTFQYVWIVLNPFVSSDGVFVAQLTFYTNSAAPGSVVTCEILGAPLLYSGVTIQTWRLGLYSNLTGWPNVGTYAEGRLWLASAAFPNRFDACVANGISGVNNGAVPGYVNFAPTDQYGNVTAANAISYTFNAPDANPILWMVPDLQGVLCGTKAGEWIVQAPATGGIAPNNIVARRATTIGCANIEPRRAEHTIIFVQRYLRKIMEYFADVFSGKFTAPNLAKDARQLTAFNIQEIAYQQELAPIVWARVNNGLIGTTYKRDTLMTSAGPTLNGWHQHTLGSARQVESIVVGSSVNGTLDALMAVTNDPAKNVRFVEILSPIIEEGTLQSAAQYVDEGIVPTSTVAVAVSASFPYGGLQLNGLWNLNGYTVTAWLGGLDCGDYTVANGSISVPYGDGIGNGQGSFPVSSGANRNDQGLFTAAFASGGITANGAAMFSGALPALVGFSYTSQGRAVRPNAPPESGARSGPAFGKWRRSQWIMGQFEGSQGVSWGVSFNDLVPVNFTKFTAGPAMTVDQQFTGIVRDNAQADYSFDNRLGWQVTRPFICNVQTIGAAIETQDI